MEFQSTRPAWGATCIDVHCFCAIRVSIHAPRVGRDEPLSKQVHIFRRFQSTRPAWGATDLGDHLPVGVRVSIHAPRVGRDVVLDFDA